MFTINPHIRTIVTADSGGATPTDTDKDAGATAATAESADESEDPDDKEPEGADQLGDAGKKALDRMKEKWRAERDRRRELEQQLAGDGTEDKAAAEAITKAHARILRSEIKAAAKGKFADPADAFRFLDLDQFEVSEDGEVDEQEIADAIADVLAKKPYLAAGQPGRFTGGADQGARKESRPRQLTRSELGQLTPEQRLEAYRKGQLKDLLN